jgi:predicted enzyme related to lactoylglutathione lyase
MKNESYICHIVLPSKNLQESSRFYREVFGWKVEPQPGASSLDLLPPAGKGISAELNIEEKEVVPSIFASDIRAVLERIKRFGGKVVQDKTPIGEQAEHGYFALFEDPNGNKMCLYSEK